MELRMNPVTLPAPLTFNYDELKAELIERAVKYENMVYTDDQISKAKSDRAMLNRLKKALNDERIKQEREYMQPFASFKGQINEIIGIIDKPVAAIDKQVKAFEEQKRQAKQKAIEEFFEGCKFPVPVRLEQIAEAKWLNASYSMETVKEDIVLRIDQIISDLDACRALPEYAFEAEQMYLSTLDLRRALGEANRLRDVAARKAEFEARKAAQEAANRAQMEAAEKARQEAIEAQQAATVAEKETVEPAPEQARHWLTFRACMTVDDARALREFFTARGIEFEVV